MTNWSRYCRLLLIVTALASLALYAAVLEIDPYDTGRFALFHRAGVPLYGQRMADASRGRDPQFDSAVIGNSSCSIPPGSTPVWAAASSAWRSPAPGLTSN